MNRRQLLIGASALVLLPATRARAAAVRDFDPAAFQAAQEAGQGVVVYVHAPW